MQNSILVPLTLFSYFSNHLCTLRYGLEDAYNSVIALCATASYLAGIQ